MIVFRKFFCLILTRVEGLNALGTAVWLKTSTSYFFFSTVALSNSFHILHPFWCLLYKQQFSNSYKTKVPLSKGASLAKILSSLHFRVSWYWMIFCHHKNEGRFNSQFFLDDHCTVLVSTTQYTSYADDTQLDDLPFLQLKKFDMIAICAELIYKLGCMHSQQDVLIRIHLGLLEQKTWCTNIFWWFAPITYLAKGT